MTLRLLNKSHRNSCTPETPFCILKIHSPYTLMVKRNSTVVVLIGLVLVASTLYLTIDFAVRAEQGGSQFITATYLRLQRTLQVIETHSSHASQATADPNKNCSGGTLMFEKYCVVSPYENEVRNASKVGSVTLCTQGTVEFLKHVVVLCHRWNAPVSVAVYSPTEEYKDAHIVVHLLRQCDTCVRNWVNWHFFYPENMELPPADQMQLIRDCSSFTEMKSKKRRQGTYPINVGRNVARRFAATPFVFSIDIELYPSLGIPAKFERMLQSQALSTANQVWVFPVFEVASSVRAPFLKSELRKLYSTHRAISFHKYRCYTCHKIPNVTQWLSHEEGMNVSEVKESLEPLRIWSTVKRNRQFNLQDWEPFFIGTTEDPEFDIRLSWEGKVNKMQMAYEMCMQDYDFLIVENAFLVHSPGINIYNAKSEKFRMKHAVANYKVLNMVKKSLIEKYGGEKDCG